MDTPFIDERSVQLRESYLADLGELAGPLTHEFNNLLNTLLLHLAVWQKSGTPEGGAFEAIRRQANAVADVTARFQQYRQRSQLNPMPLDVNLILKTVAEEMSSSPDQAPIALELENALPTVRGHEADLRRLYRFLLGNAVRSVSAQNQAVVARTRLENGLVFILVEDAGLSVPVEELTGLFEPGKTLREGMCRLELAACQSIVRRLNGILSAKPRPGGGLNVSVRLPKDKDSVVEQ